MKFRIIRSILVAALKFKMFEGLLMHLMSNFDEVSCHGDVLLVIFDQMTQNEILLVVCILPRFDIVKFDAVTQFQKTVFLS